MVSSVDLCGVEWVWWEDGDDTQVRLQAAAGGQVPVELVQVEHGEHDAEQVDQDPDGVQDVVAVRPLNGIERLPLSTGTRDWDDAIEEGCGDGQAANMYCR